MDGEVEIGRSVAALVTTMNDQGHEHVDQKRLQQILDEATGGERKLAIDEGGGIHDAGSGARVAAIRRAPSGEWIVESQNPQAPASEAELPHSGRPKKGLLAKLGLGG
jgi:hypothetical protein